MNVRCTEADIVRLNMTNFHIIRLFLYTIIAQSCCFISLARLLKAEIDVSYATILKILLRAFLNYNDVSQEISSPRPRFSRQALSSKFSTGVSHSDMRKNYSRLTLLCLSRSLVYYNAALKLHFISFKGKVFSTLRQHA
jgi:hypothetical protein